MGSAQEDVFPKIVCSSSISGHFSDYASIGSESIRSNLGSHTGFYTPINFWKVWVR
jgi:hypothetical protein